MQLAVHVLTYDVNRYINAMLRNVAPHVDKIYLAYSKRPFSYIPSSRETRTNPTHLEDIDLRGYKSKVEVIHGDWATEEDARNACFERAKGEGFDWLIIQDADEFYTEESWAHIRRHLEQRPDCELFKTTWFNFWKSSEFIIVHPRGSIKDLNAGFAIRCREGLKFVSARRSNSTNIRMLDCPCYHYGWVKPDQEMLEKVTQYSHSHQFNGRRWYEIKWLNWNYNTINLGPFGTSWHHAIRFPLHQPDFAFQFAYPVNPEKIIPFRQGLRGLIYDYRVETFHALSRIKHAVVG
jgi:hypothetical protein